MKRKKSSKVAHADGGEDGVGVNGFFVGLSTDEESVRHEVVHNPGVTLGVTVESGKGGRINNGFGAAGTQELVADIVGDLGVGEA